VGIARSGMSASLKMTVFLRSRSALKAPAMKLVPWEKPVTYCDRSEIIFTTPMVSEQGPGWALQTGIAQTQNQHS
jgi:hypothetical protein